MYALFDSKIRLQDIYSTDKLSRGKGCINEDSHSDTAHKSKKLESTGMSTPLVLVKKFWALWSAGSRPAL